MNRDYAEALSQVNPKKVFGEPLLRLLPRQGLFLVAEWSYGSDDNDNKERKYINIMMIFI
jgi:hypothetical protein